MLQKVGPVAYKLELPQESRIHPTFHVSYLKKKLGQGVEVQTELPSTQKEDDSLIPRPQAVLEQRKKKGSTEVLIHWQRLAPSETTWENLEDLCQQFPTLTLEDKGEFKGAALLRASSDNHVAKDEDLHGHVHKKISIASHVAKEI